MRHDGLKFLIQNTMNVHAALIEEFLNESTDEEYAKMPTFLLSKEEKDFLWKQATIFHPMREYKDGEELVSVYSMGGMPFKIKTNEP